MAEVDVADVGAAAAGAADRLVDRSERRAPADHGQSSALFPETDLLLGEAVGDAEDLVGADVGHRLVVGRGIIDMAGADILLDAADPVGEARRAGLDPDPGELGVALVGIDLLALAR